MNHQKKPKDNLAKLLEDAVEEKQSKTVDVLLNYLLEEWGKKAYESYGVLIETAAKEGDKETIEVFLARGFSLNGGRVVNKTENGKASFTVYESNPDKNRLRGFVSNPLLAAIKFGEKEMVEWLVERGALTDIPVFIPDRKNGDMTILDYAEMEGTPETVEYLKGKLSSQPIQVD